MTEAWWAYGVVASAWTPPPMFGVADSVVHALRYGDVAVLASAVPGEEFSAAALEHRLEDLEALAELAQAHDRVLQTALATTDVAPLRMCTLYASRGALEDMLRAKAPHFEQLLAWLRDKREWGVKGFLAPAAAPEPVAAPASGAEYLARRRAERERAEGGSAAAESAAAAVHHALAVRAAAATLAPPQDRRLTGRPTEMILNGSYLVPRPETETFARLVDEQRRRHEGLVLELTGPWPPYTFVSDAS